MENVNTPSISKGRIVFEYNLTLLIFNVEVPNCEDVEKRYKVGPEGIRYCNMENRDIY